MPNSAPFFTISPLAVELVSTNSAGEQAIYGQSLGPVFFPDGRRVAFVSDAPNLVGGDPDLQFHLFVKNVDTGALRLVSTTATGGKANGGIIGEPILLEGGKKVIFISTANNLVPNDTNGYADIFIKNLVTGAVVRVNLQADGSQISGDKNGYSTGVKNMSVSADGTKVAFEYDNNAGACVYLKDLTTGELTRIAVKAGQPQLSADGTKLLYAQHDPQTSRTQIYLQDLVTGEVTCVSTNADGVVGESHSTDPRFFPDGTRIAFTSEADNLVPNDTDGWPNVFVKNLITGEIIAASTGPSGKLGPGWAPLISPDGSKIAFVSSGSHLLPGGATFDWAHIKDLHTGEIIRVPGRMVSSFSADGSRIGFYGDDASPSDSNNYYDSYIADLTWGNAYTAHGAPIQVVPAAVVSDKDSSDYGGGSLTIAITAGRVAGDQLTLASVAGRDIAVSGDQLLVNGVLVGTIAATATSLSIAFNANATDTIVKWLVEALHIASTAADPTEAVRSVTFTLVDGGGTADGGKDTAIMVEKIAFLPAGANSGLRLKGGAGDDLLQGFGGDDRLQGGRGSDVLEGWDGDDRLDGGEGADRMVGGSGDDLYLVDRPTDSVVETGAGGTDTVAASVSYTLARNVENLVLTGSGKVGGTGNGLANLITGNAAANALSGAGGDDILDGGAGGDTMNGGKGNDRYVVDNVADKVIEASATGGIDTVESAVAFTLGANVENLILTGTGSTRGTGNDLANRITGNSGANLLDGKAGADVMTGGGGKDSYVVDNAGDQVVELAAQGTDTVQSSIGWTLGAYLENLVLTGTAAIDGTGNAAANGLTGNSAANVLNGKGGADTMTGLAGDDTYVVDNAGDVVVEVPGGGLDLVRSSVSHTLAAGVENLKLTGSAASGIGNALANAITGNGADNILNGKGGADKMTGLDGDDVYYVNDVGDQVVEGAGDGTDTVNSRVAYTLGANLENLNLKGTADIDAAGNAWANTIVGNDGDNLISGLGGNDVLRGGRGADELRGGAGEDRLSGGRHADRFVFDAPLGSTNIDHVLDFERGSDRLVLDSAIFQALGAGALAPGAFALGTAAQDADDRILYDAATGTLRYDADGAGGAAAVRFAVLDTQPATLAAADFVVI